MHWPEPGLPSDDSSPASWTQYILPALSAFSCIPVEKKVLTWMIKVQMIKLRSQDQARAEPRLPDSRLIEGSGSKVIPTSQPQPRCLRLPTKGPQAWQPFIHVSHPGPVQLQRVHMLSLLSPCVPSSYPLLPTLSPLCSKDTVHNRLFLLIPAPYHAYLWLPLQVSALRVQTQRYSPLCPLVGHSRRT